MARMPVFAALALLLLPAAAGAVTRHVPAQYGTIQAAIDAAQFGDVVQVAAGTYHENIFMQNAGVSIIGAGAAVTTIDGGGAARVIEFFSVSSTTTFSGFRLTGGAATTGGGGIRCVLASPQVLDCIIEGNTAPDGGGIFLTQSRPQIRNCTIRNNTATGSPSVQPRGGGMSLENNSPALIEDCEILDNEAPPTYATSVGGGIWIGDAGTVIVRRSRIRGNSAWYGGGVAVGTTSSTLLEDNVIAANNGNSAVSFDGPGTIRRCSISFNPTVGAIISGTCRITSCTIAFNVGTGLTLSGPGPIVDHTIVARNFNAPGVNNQAPYTTTSFTCNDVWGHQFGDYIGPYAPPTGTNYNTSEDPMFCNPGLGDLGLAIGSPCSAVSSPCGLVGAYDVTCAVTEVRRSTWGKLKARYR